MRSRFTATPLAVRIPTGRIFPPRVVAPCGYPEMTWGWAISATQQYGVGLGFRHGDRLVEPLAVAFTHPHQ